MMKYVYDRAVFHSRCNGCGSNFSFRNKDNYELAKANNTLPRQISQTAIQRIKDIDQERNGLELIEAIEQWRAKWNYSPPPKEDNNFFGKGQP